MTDTQHPWPLFWLTFQSAPDDDAVFRDVEPWHVAQHGSIVYVRESEWPTIKDKLDAAIDKQRQEPPK